MVSLLPQRKTEKKPLLQSSFFRDNLGASVAGGIFLAVALFYGGIFWYGNRMEGEIKSMQAEMQNLQAERDITLENKVRDFAGRIASIRTILSGHIYGSKVFPLIEGIAHPKAQFTDFSFSAENGAITLGVASQDYVSFGQQIFALEQNPNIHNVQISNVKLSKSGQILFNVSFEADKSLYQ